MELRDYQRAALERVDAGWADHRAQVLSAPTGAGKTAMACALMRSQPGRSWFVAHLTTLCGQTVSRFREYGVRAGLLQGSNTKGLRRSVVVCSVRTLQKRDYARLGDLRCGSDCVEGCDGRNCETLYSESFDLGRARLPDLLVIDECHEAHRYVRRLARAVVQNGGRVLGLTATPYADFMSRSYSRLVGCDTTLGLIGSGALVGFKYFVARPLYDLSNRRGEEYRPAGSGESADFSSSQIRAALRPAVYGDLPEEWVRYTDRVFDGPVKTLIAAPSIDIATSICREFESALSDHPDDRYRGLRFETCSARDGKDGLPTTREVLRRFDTGASTGLASVAKLAIGFDRPEAMCLVLARPFASLTPYVQWLGRVLRTSDGKDRALVLDHGQNFGRLGERLERHLSEGPLRFGRPSMPGVPAERLCAECGELLLGRALLCPSCGVPVVQPSLSPDAGPGAGVLERGPGEMVEIPLGLSSKLYVLAAENVERLHYELSCQALMLNRSRRDAAWSMRRMYVVMRTPLALFGTGGECDAPVDLHPAAVAQRASDDVMDVYRARLELWDAV